MGADAAITGSAADLGREIASDTGARGVDLVFDCATKGTTDLALQVAGSGGRVVFTGIPSELHVPMDVHTWRRKELQVHQVRRSNHDGPAALAMLARETGFFAPLVTHERPLAGIGDAFALVENYQDGVGKLVVRLDS
jgi:threonine dehydrogenase-like Zn-dependent dehydrogenase